MIATLPFIPAIADTGLGGWAQIQRDRAEDIARLTRMEGLANTRAEARESLRGLEALSDLLDDRKLLDIVLGAHGLADQIDNRALIERVIEQGPGRDGLASRLGDVRWLDLARTFSGGVRGLTDRSIERMLDDHARETHTALVAREAPGLGTALAAKDRLVALAEGNASEDLIWLTVIGDDALRDVFQTALGLPQSFWTLDIDALMTRMGRQFEQRFGAPVSEAIAESETRETLLERYVALDDATRSTATGGGAIALALLSA